jgi:DNA-binding NarL/FixJ family response regulator
MAKDRAIILCMAKSHAIGVHITSERSLNVMMENGPVRRVAPTSPKILLLADQALSRAGYNEVLGNMSLTLATACTLEDALSQVATSLWDLLILDLINVFKITSAIATLRSASPGLPILAVCELSERQIGRSILSAGARGYFHKGGSVEGLRVAVHTVLVGRRYVSETLAPQLAPDMEGRWAAPLHERLSGRELEVFQKLALGTSVSQIARELKLSIKTVSTFRSRLLIKLGFTTNADIVTYALRNGLRP